MKTKMQILGTVAVIGLVAGCSWHDDYRSRQPRVLEAEELKSPNVSSEQFVNIETNQNLRNPPPKSMPGIDDLSKIPAIQDGSQPEADTHAE